MVINMLHRKCDMCGQPAEVDTKTIYGDWAYLCPSCNRAYGIKMFQTKLADLNDDTPNTNIQDKVNEVSKDDKY